MRWFISKLLMGFCPNLIQYESIQSFQNPFSKGNIVHRLEKQVRNNFLLNKNPPSTSIASIRGFFHLLIDYIVSFQRQASICTQPAGLDCDEINLEKDNTEITIESIAQRKHLFTTPTLSSLMAPLVISSSLLTGLMLLSISQFYFFLLQRLFSQVLFFFINGNLKKSPFVWLSSMSCAQNLNCLTFCFSKLLEPNWSRSYLKAVDLAFHSIPYCAWHRDNPYYPWQFCISCYSYGIHDFVLLL